MHQGQLAESGPPGQVFDAPRSEGKNVPLTVLALTSPLLYVRMHGRNAETWNVRGGSAAERFDYLYSDEELAEWAPQLKELSQQAEQAADPAGPGSGPTGGPGAKPDDKVVDAEFEEVDEKKKKSA